MGRAGASKVWVVAEAESRQKWGNSVSLKLRLKPDVSNSGFKPRAAEGTDGDR